MTLLSTWAASYTVRAITAASNASGVGEVACATVTSNRTMI